MGRVTHATEKVPSQSADTALRPCFQSPRMRQPACPSHVPLHVKAPDELPCPCRVHSHEKAGKSFRIGTLRKVLPDQDLEALPTSEVLINTLGVAGVIR